MNRGRFLGLAIAAVVVVMLAVLPLLALDVPGLLPGPTYSAGTLQLLALCLVIASLALGYHLLFGVAGLLSFGHALYFAAGTYGLGIVLQRTDWPLIPAACVVMVGGIVLAYVLGSVSLRVSGIAFAMVTLAFAQASNVLVRRDPGHVTGGDDGLSMRTDAVPASLIGVDNTRNLYWIALLLLIVTYAVVVWLQSSRIGHLAAATRENDQRVRVLGGRPYLVRLIVFTIAGTLATIAGMVYLLLQSGATPGITTSDFTLSLLVMVVLGGVGSRWGAVVGAVLYTLLNQRLTVIASSDTVAGLPAVLRVPLSEPLFLLGVLFILVVIFLPGGISGAMERATARLRTGTDPAVAGPGRMPEPADQRADNSQEAVR
ncbi:branched-chain amino acid ABC transporter permease [Branchiibius sp. NY16-3462-2]|uniref:branched-chain amino acid ABC transporter permease n=1 Tax=Branchiibius sp. NY16-3462-2 TaxID=1807500 RepID=UPI000A6D0A00|nr:branched-chain amino acid ABC transporter permease [Branchiibius sp. NY16-3462-2]